MVRHEAADALGSLENEAYLEILRKHQQDRSDIVADTCIVAESKLREALDGIV